MDFKYCPDCREERELKNFRIKGKKKDGSYRYDKFCITHSRDRDKKRKQKNVPPKRDVIEPMKSITKMDKKSDNSYNLSEEDVRLFNELIGLLKEEYQKIKGNKIYVKT